MDQVHIVTISSGREQFEQESQEHDCYRAKHPGVQPLRPLDLLKTDVEVPLHFIQSQIRVATRFLKAQFNAAREFLQSEFDALFPLKIAQLCDRRSGGTGFVFWCPG
jgi:hypothetical protein